MSDSADKKNLSEAWQEAITARIIRDIQEGVPTWCKPWHTDKKSLSVALPHNASTGRPYQGGNVLHLWAIAMEMGYQSHGWMTYNQANKLGARVRAKAKGTQIIFVDFTEKVDKETGEKTKRPFLKVSSTFNLDQIEGLPVAYRNPAPMLPESEYQYEAARYAKDSRVRLIQYGAPQAVYYPTGDAICLPYAKDFTDENAFAGTLLHELTHASGHPERLGRKFGSKWGDEGSLKQRAMEELIAELGSAFFSAHLGIPPTTRTQNAAYIKSWLEVLGGDHRAVVSAAAYASQAFAYMDAKVQETRQALSSAAAE